MKTKIDSRLMFISKLIRNKIANDYLVEMTPDEVMVVLMRISDKETNLAINNGWQFVIGNRPSQTIVEEFQHGEDEKQPLIKRIFGFILSVIRD